MLYAIRKVIVFEIWITQGQGGVMVARKKSLRLALRYVEHRKGEGSFGIKYPNGKWHQWSERRT